MFHWEIFHDQKQVLPARQKGFYSSGGCLQVFEVSVLMELELLALFEVLNPLEAENQRMLSQNFGLLWLEWQKQRKLERMRLRE